MSSVREFLRIHSKTQLKHMLRIQMASLTYVVRIYNKRNKNVSFKMVISDYTGCCLAEEIRVLLTSRIFLIETSYMGK